MDEVSKTRSMDEQVDVPKDTPAAASPRTDVTVEEALLALVAANLSVFEEPESRYCPDEMELAGFVEQTLTERERERVRLHVSRCPSCRDLVDEVTIETAPDPKGAAQKICVRQKLHELIEMAQKCVGGSRDELAAALGCDVSALYPETAEPGLEFLANLARVLDWPLEVIRDTLANATPIEHEGAEDEEFSALDSAIQMINQNGLHEQAVELTRRANVVARTPEQRALSCAREGMECNALGFSEKAVEAYRRGLRETAISDELRQFLRVNLANALYTLGELDEACALSDAVMRHFEAHAPEARREVGSRAFAYYVRGHANRRLMETDLPRAKEFAQRARADLREAYRGFSELHEQCKDACTGGIARTCQGGVLEAEVVLGVRTAREALRELELANRAVLDPVRWPPGDGLESFGWWCVFGAHIAAHYLEDGSWKHEFQTFVDHGLRIAGQLKNWSMRERLFSIYFECRRVRSEDAGALIDIGVDQHRLRLIAGIAGRFPAFRRLAWRILAAAKPLE